VVAAGSKSCTYKTANPTPRRVILLLISKNHPATLPISDLRVLPPLKLNSFAISELPRNIFRNKNYY